mmetsp:Transcript_40124/g.114701  ORF Transcript_40124/g.114701 Transcript_40124/m.114701 type:complete len:591 (-) Transcript_40124:47-1819(-)
MEEGRHEAGTTSAHSGEKGSLKELLSSGKQLPSYGTEPGSAPAAPTLRIPIVCWFILVVELCERLAFYTITGSQAFFLEHIGFSLSSAGGINATMWTLCTVLAVVASWLADVALGRYLTILTSGAVYALGALICAVAAWPSFENSGVYFVGVIGLLPIATAGIKANISNFGADQYDTSDPNHEQAQERFFSIFYLSINVGAAVSYGFFTTFASSGGIGVPKDYGYFVAYLLMGVCMCIAVGVYFAGRRSYKVHPLQPRSALANVALVVHRRAVAGSLSAMAVWIGVWCLVASIILSTMKSLIAGSGAAMMYAAFFCAGVGTLAVVVACLKPSWLHEPGKEPEEKDVEVENFLKVIPVLFTGQLAFGALYNSMQFWYQQQACQMDLRAPLGGGGQLSGSFFMIADCLGIVVATPIAVDWLNPLLENKLGGRFGHGAKFGLGSAFGGLSVLAAAHLELTRRAAPVLDLASNCAPDGVRMSALSSAWMTMPFFLMGLGEIYTQPVLMHFAYSQSPPSMRTLAAATGLVIGAVSTSLFTVQVAVLSPYVPNDLNHGHLEYGYFFNLVLGGVFYAAFLRALRTFEARQAPLPAEG